MCLRCTPRSQSSFYLRNGGWTHPSLARWPMQGRSFSKLADSSRCVWKKETWLHLLFQRKAWEFSLTEAGQKTQVVAERKKLSPYESNISHPLSSCPRQRSKHFSYALSKRPSFSWQRRASTALRILPPLYWSSVYTLTSEMTFLWARSPERKNFSHLGLLTAARVDLARFFSYADVKNRTFLDAKTQECDTWLRRRKGKNTYIATTIKKQVRVTRDLSTVFQEAGEADRSHRYLAVAAVVTLLAQAASRKPPKPSAWMEIKGSLVLKF